MKAGSFGSEVVDPLGFCKGWVMSKDHMSPFERVHNNDAVLDYLHIDLWGPASQYTPSGNKYFLNIIDDFLG